MLADHDARRAEAFRAAQDAAEVVRVLHAVEDHDETTAVRDGQDVVEVAIRKVGREGDHALVLAARGEFVEVLARTEYRLRAPRFRLHRKGFRHLVPFLHADLVDRAPRFHEFLYRVLSFYDHKFSILANSSSRRSLSPVRYK